MEFISLLGFWYWTYYEKETLGSLNVAHEQTKKFAYKSQLLSKVMTT